MANNHFNKWEFKQANSLINSNPFEAKLRFEKYLEKYPNDYSAYTYYCTCLININMLDEAEKILNYVESLYKKNTNYCYNTDKINILEGKIFYNKIRLLAYRGKYEELLHFCLNFDNKYNLNYIEINSVEFYCKKQLGLLDSNIKNVKTYLFNQIANYKEEDFYEHIKKHLADYNKDSDNPNKNIFVPNFPIKEVIEEIKKYIPSDKKIFHSCLDDTYIFKYNECGRDHNRLVNHFKVICFHNTTDIITLCPADYCENLPYIDLNYLIKPKEEKTKRLSRSQIFYNKWFSEKKDS